MRSTAGKTLAVSIWWVEVFPVSPGAGCSTPELIFLGKDGWRRLRGEIVEAEP